MVFIMWMLKKLIFRYALDRDVKLKTNTSTYTYMYKLILLHMCTIFNQLNINKWNWNNKNNYEFLQNLTFKLRFSHYEKLFYINLLSNLLQNKSRILILIDLFMLLKTLNWNYVLFFL